VQTEQRREALFGNAGNIQNGYEASESLSYDYNEWEGHRRSYASRCLNARIACDAPATGWAGFEPQEWSRDPLALGLPKRRRDKPLPPMMTTITDSRAQWLSSTVFAQDHSSGQSEARVCDVDPAIEFAGT
jgi:hypothetical protein